MTRRAKTLLSILAVVLGLIVLDVARHPEDAIRGFKDGFNSVGR